MTAPNTSAGGFGPGGYENYGNSTERIGQLDDLLHKRLMKLNETDKRYHNDVFNDIRRDEAFVKKYSNGSHNLR